MTSLLFGTYQSSCHKYDLFLSPLLQNGPTLVLACPSARFHYAIRSSVLYPLNLCHFSAQYPEKEWIQYDQK